MKTFRTETLNVLSKVLFNIQSIWLSRKLKIKPSVQSSHRFHSFVVFQEQYWKIEVILVRDYDSNRGEVSLLYILLGKVVLVKMSALVF